jgi:hypothetical protein
MFPPALVAFSADQHESIDSLIYDAQAEELNVSGAIVNNEGPGLLRVVLVLDNEPQLGSSKWDLIFDFKGELIATGSDLEVAA